MVFVGSHPFKVGNASSNLVPSTCRFVSDMPKTVKKTCGSSSGEGRLAVKHMETEVRFLYHKQSSLKYSNQKVSKLVRFLAFLNYLL